MAAQRDCPKCRVVDLDDGETLARPCSEHVTFRPKPLERLDDPEADAHFVTSEDGEITGLIFRCPIHEDCPGYLGPNFALGRGPVWHRDGDDLASITVAPSIRVGAGDPDSPCHWHGFIRNGRFEHCGDAR